MHAVEESSTNEGYLVNDQQDDDFPLFLETQNHPPCTRRGRGNLQTQQWARHPSGHALHAVTQPVAGTRNDGGANNA